MTFHKLYQQRVVREKAELDAKLSKLRQFFTGEVFKTLDEPERERMLRQEQHMHNYSVTLGERIEAFE